VLSKLRHIRVCHEALTREEGGLTSTLRRLYGADLIDLRPHPGGTHGICFIGELAGQERFFKTHALPSGRQTLEREAAFLGATAGDRADACLIESEVGSGARIWLHMRLLRPVDVLTPPVARQVICGYENGLSSSFPNSSPVPKTESIALLFPEAEAGLAMLTEQRLLSQTVHDQIRGYLDRLRSNYGSWPMQLCHGDLGPGNVLADKHGPVVIDWEDAFWGIAGYDYLYWLTFFNNRQWLTPQALGHTPWGHANEVALMVVILLLKCVLSVRDCSYHKNSISFDQRLREVINLDRGN
jgi:thiamine kinase-like enzyme